VRPDSPEIEGGWSSAEIELAQELPRLLGAPGLAVAATVIRVPVFFGLAQAVYADLAREVPLAELETALRGAPGLLLAGSVEDRLAVAVEAARRRKERAAVAHEEDDDDRDPDEEMIEDGLELEADEEDEEGERDDEDDEEALERRERALEREELRRARESEREREHEREHEHEESSEEVVPDLLPGPVDVAGSAFVHVARLRLDPERPSRLALWLAFDEIRRGVAMNAVGILELAMRARGAAKESV
jgi:aspartate-semialdehyde dehydrogenase